MKKMLLHFYPLDLDTPGVRGLVQGAPHPLGDLHCRVSRNHNHNHNQMELRYEPVGWFWSVGLPVSGLEVPLPCSLSVQTYLRGL